MLVDSQFVRHSLELNLFYLRLFKEHMIFFNAALINKDHGLAHQAEGLKCELEAMLGETISYAQGILSPQVLASRELVTPLTIATERATEFYTCIPIDSELSRMELSLCEGDSHNSVIPPGLVEQVYGLNQRVISLTSMVLDYKQNLYQHVASCQVFMFTYPSLIHHTIEETKHSLETLYRVQNRQEPYVVSDVGTIEAFWNHVMEEHSEYLRGFLDPTQEELFKKANNFVREFDELTRQAKRLSGQMANVRGLTLRTLDATNRLREFKASSTEGLLQCKVKSIANPLLADHVYREASHYLRILNLIIAKLP